MKKDVPRQDPIDEQCDPALECEQPEKPTVGECNKEEEEVHWDLSDSDCDDVPPAPVVTNRRKCKKKESAKKKDNIRKRTPKPAPVNPERESKCIKVSEDESGTNMNCTIIWDLANEDAYENEGDEDTLTIEVKVPRSGSRQRIPLPPISLDDPGSNCDATTIDIDDTPVQNVVPYKSFDHYYDRVPSKLVIPNPGATLSTLTIGRNRVWTGQEGDRIVYANVHWKDGRSVLVFLVLYPRGSSKDISLTFVRRNNTWILTKNYNCELGKLKVPLQCWSAFAIDIASNKNSNCHVFEAMMDDIPTRFYYPKLGKIADRVYYGKHKIWGSEACQCRQEPYTWRAISLRLYLRNKTPKLLKITLKDHNDRLGSQHFIFAESSWVRIDESSSQGIKRTLRTFAQRQQILEQCRD